MNRSNYYLGKIKDKCSYKYNIKEDTIIYHFSIDSSSDVENFGCSYDELSFISYIMCHQYKDTKFDDNKLEIIKYIKDNFNKLIELNNRNSHKYHGQTFSPIMIIESERFFFYKV